VLTDRRLAFCAALTAILGLFIAGCLFVHPIADDFDFASNARDAGVATAWRQQYLTWNGRYASNLLALAIPLPGHTLIGYRTAVASMLAATVAGLYLFMRALAPEGFTRGEIVTGALALCVLYLCQMPSIGEGIYWYTSAVTYHAALVLAAVHFACVAYSRRRMPALAAAIALGVAVAGFNEVIMLMLLAVYGALFLVVATAAGPERVRFSTLLAVTAVCVVVVAGSPGNGARLDEYPLRHQLGRSAALTALQTIRFLTAWVSSGPLLIASMLWLPHASRVMPGLAPGSRRVRLMLCLAGLLLVVPAAAFPAYWATGVLGQHRTMNTAYFAFLILWFAAVGLWSASNSRRAGALRAVAGELSAPLTLVLLLSLALTHNSYAVGADLMSGRFARFDQDMRERDRLLRQCREVGRASCDIDPVSTVPRSFFVLDVASNPGDWVNVAYARYYRVAQVRLRPGVQIDHVRH
jgi:Family of unknown function (DUF6056)